MGTGSLALALVLLATGEPASDVIPMNTHAFRIPIQVAAAQRDKIKELILFASTDQGMTWNEVASVAPDQDGFKFHAPADGMYWFNICLVDAQGKRQPPDLFKTPPRQKVLVDTLKPNVRIVSAERKGDEIQVRWEVQEENPDVTTLKLEYHTPDAPAWMWYGTPITKEMNGETSFHFANVGPVSLRLQMMDLAGNVGMDQREVTARSAAPAASASANPPTGGTVTGTASSTSPANGLALPPPAPPSASASGPSLQPPPVAGPGLTGSAAGGSGVAAGGLGSNAPAPAMTSGNAGMPAAFPQNTGLGQAGPSSVERLGARSEGREMNPRPSALDSRLSGSTWEHTQPVQQTNLSQADAHPPQERSWGPGANALQPGYVGGMQGQTLPQAGQRWSSGLTIPLQITNSTQVTLDYEVTKVGPSGVGRVVLFLTKDEGRTWEAFAEDADLKPPMTVNLPGEGVYGLRLVVSSRAGLGGRVPQAGDPPQMRVEVDTTPPVVKLFYPQPDTQRRDALLLTWNASDHNLAPNPITLQWAERPDGQWQNIATDLTNSGRYVWQVTANMPYRVFLRVVARDTAGNVAVDESPEPVLIDLHEPEGQLLGIAGAMRRP
jgi:hypothetical protein